MKRFSEISQITAIIPTLASDPTLDERLENVLEQSWRPTDVMVLTLGPSALHLKRLPYGSYARTIHVADPKTLMELTIRTPYTVIVNPGEWLSATAFEAMELALDLHPECSAGQANRLITSPSEDLAQETFASYFGTFEKPSIPNHLKTPTAIFRTNQGWAAKWSGRELEVFFEGDNPSVYGIPFPLGHHYECPYQPASPVKIRRTALQAPKLSRKKSKPYAPRGSSLFLPSLKSLFHEGRLAPP